MVAAAAGGTVLCTTAGVKAAPEASTSAVAAVTALWARVATSQRPAPSTMASPAGSAEPRTACMPCRSRGARGCGTSPAAGIPARRSIASAVAMPSSRAWSYSITR